MKIGIYTPYPDTLGGGERYMMTIAETLSGAGHKVDVFWDDQEIKAQLIDRFSLELEKVRFVPNIFAMSRLKKWRAMRGYDVLFFLSDGSLPFLFARRNFIHVQVPFTNVGGRGFLNRLKLKKISGVFCNSCFTKSFVDREFGIKSRVIYPPVAVENLKPLPKKKAILSVGRLGEPLNNKKQEVLLEVFKKMVAGDKKGELKGWEFILVAALKEKHQPLLDGLKDEARGFPVRFLTNQPYRELVKLYGEAKIFWHAAGFGVDDRVHPERVEHFGMVPVEAMAAGAVPVVVKKGGLPESVRHGKNGYLWETKKALAELSLKLIRSENLRRKLAERGVKDARKFSKAVFSEKIADLIG